MLDSEDIAHASKCIENVLYSDCTAPSAKYPVSVIIWRWKKSKSEGIISVTYGNTNAKSIWMRYFSPNWSGDLYLDEVFIFKQNSVLSHVASACEKGFKTITYNI